MPVERRSADAAPLARPTSVPDLFAALDLTLPGLEAVRAAAERGDSAGATSALVDSLATFAAKGLHADGGCRAESPWDALPAYRCLRDGFDLLAAAGEWPSNPAVKPDEASLAVIRSAAIRMLDAFLATVRPDGANPFETGDLLDLLAEGAERFKQGEYAWPVAQSGQPLPAGAGVPLPPPFTSVYLPDSRLAVMRSDWTPRAHYLTMRSGSACPGSRRFVLGAFGEGMVTDMGRAGADRTGMVPCWTTGLFLDALSDGSDIRFVKPVGDLPGYWLVTQREAHGEPVGHASWYLRSELPLQGNGGLVTATAGPGRPGLQVIPSRPLEIRFGRGPVPGVQGDPADHDEHHWVVFDSPVTEGLSSDPTFVLAPYERIAPAPGSFQIEPFGDSGSSGARCYRILHHLGYDLLVVGDGGTARFDQVELVTDARFLLIRVRGGVVVGQQHARGSQVLFRGEELSQ